MKKILILHTSVGLGHKSMAQNIGWRLQRASFEVRIEDILQVQGGGLVNLGTTVHQFINKHLPGFWSFLYFYGYWLGYPFRVWLASHNYQPTLKLIQEFQPDLIISTQTTSSAIIAYLKRQRLYNGPFGIAFSDFHLHRYWLYKEADFYLANIMEQKNQMVDLGIPPAKIFVCGMMLKEKLTVDIAKIKQQFGTQQEQKVVLIGSGSLGINLPQDFISQLLKRPELFLLVLCGKNQELHETLKNRFTQKNIAILNFYQPMDELYSIADIFVSKPGGLSTAEALAWRLPILLSYTLPGQEELNVGYLQSKHLIMPKAENIEAAVLAEIRAGKFKQALMKNQNLKLVEPHVEELLKAVNSVLNTAGPPELKH